MLSQFDDQCLFNLILNAEQMRLSMLSQFDTIPQETLLELLTICTTDTPFSFNNKTYQEIDGVSMGSPLGPVMAEYYMSSSETFLLNQTS